MRETEVTHRIVMSHGSRSHIRGCTATQVGWKLTIGVTVHGKRSNLRQKGASGGQLRHELRTRFWATCHQEGINDAKVGGRVEFKFIGPDKNPRASSKETLGCLRIKQVQRIERHILLPSLSVDIMTVARTRV